ncbi:MAG TPA: plasmid pRiA4b ORF-3 family protein [Burkholderiaceae bacterium]
MATTVRKLAKRPSAALQLHIELRASKPKIWRRVLVAETITLAQLHAVIQAVFGWSGGHLHEFQVGDERFGTPDPEYDSLGQVRNERTTRLASALGAARTMNYVYDFGDNWQHRIKVEKTLVPDPQLELPLCIGGANATPPDDCGGLYGYHDFVAALTDPNHPEHAEMAEWIGRPWDPAAFDVDSANFRLRNPF